MRDIAVRPPGWTPPRVRLILLIFTLVLVLNAFDICATLVIVGIVGTSEEMNPLMRWSLEHGPATFVAVKTGLVVGLTSLLTLLSSRRRLAWYGLCGIAIVCAVL